MARFRKKPVEIDARQFAANGPALAEWCGGRYRQTRDEITAPNGETALLGERLDREERVTVF